MSFSIIVLRSLTDWDVKESPGGVAGVATRVG